MLGRVGYVHAGGLDAPIAVYRMGLYGEPSPVAVAPHANWQGAFEVGSVIGGTYNGDDTRTCEGSYGCPLIAWSGGHATMDGELPPPTIHTWFGNLLTQHTDGSGLHYLRNRYYDPATGRFTQADPIGLAGDLNLYGFAGGDPISNSDPFGLCAEEGGGDSTKTEVTAKYCSQENKLKLFNAQGTMVYETEAGNNTTNPGGNPNEVGSHGPAPNGTFPVQPPVMNPSPADSYGPAFFPIGAPGDVAGKRHIGIHGGRRGPMSTTYGCIRVSNEAVRQMASGYDITSITIGCPAPQRSAFDLFWNPFQ